MYITVNGVKLYYEKAGNGSPLIMVHCNSMSHKIFNAAVKVLGQHFTVYCPDSRDHGKSEKVKTLHYEDMAEDMALTPRLFHAARTIAFIDDSTYFYRDDSSASTFANNLSKKHVLSYLRANDTVWQYFHKNDKKKEYLFAFEIGMLNVYYQALSAGIDRQQIGDVLSYKPQTLFFRCLQGMLAHQQTRPLLRFAYLSVKWCYKKALFLSDKL